MKIINKGCIYDASQVSEKEKVATFPSLARLSNGDIFCSFRVGPKKNSPYDKIKLKKSTDGGNTWLDVIESFTSNFDNVPGSGHNGAVGDISPEKLMVSYTWVDRTNMDLPLINPETTGLLPTKLLTSFSNDGGSTWTPFSRADTAHHLAVASTNKPIVLKNDTILLPYESWKQYDQVNGFHSAACLLSKDKGQNWSRPVIMAEDPFQHLYFYDNRLSVAPDTGKIIDILWTHDKTKGVDAPLHINYGSSDGLEWTYPQSIGIEGQIASPLALGGERLLMTYIHRQDPPSIKVLLSTDFGKTWDTEKELEIFRCIGKQSGIGESRSQSEYWDDMSRWTFGHPCSIRLSNNTVFIGFYAGDGNTLDIHWVTLEI